MIEALIILFAQYLPFVIVGIALWFIWRLEPLKRKSAIALFVLSSIVAFIIDKTLNQIILSPRPFVVQGIEPLFAHAADNGFPSEHVLFAMVIASVVFVYSRKLGVVLGILALTVGLARVAAYVHHPIDILGGILIAVVSVSGAFYLLSRPKPQVMLETKNDKKPLF